jgi:hypothetical protein
VEAYEGTDNIYEARTAACLALCLAGNASRSWILWKLSTHVRVHCTNFNMLVTTEIVINTVNTLAHENELEELRPVIGEITE